MENLISDSQKLNKSLMKISRIVEDRLAEDVLCGTSSFVNIDFKDGWAEIEMYSSGEKEVRVMHNDNDRYSANLEKAIAKCLPEWYDVYREQEELERSEESFREYVRNIH